MVMSSPGRGGLEEPFEDGKLFGIRQLSQGPHPDLPFGSVLGLNSESP